MSGRSPKPPTQLPNEIWQAIYGHLLPPAGRWSYNITEFDNYVAAINTNARAVWPNNLRLEVTVHNMDFAQLHQFFTAIGAENVTTIRSISIDLQNIPVLDQSVNDTLWLLVQRVHQVPDLADRMFFHSDPASRWRLQAWARIVRQAIQIGRAAGINGDSVAQLRARYLAWRASATARLAQAEANL